MKSKLKNQKNIMLEDIKALVIYYEVLLARSRREGKFMYSSLTGIYRVSHPGGSKKFKYLVDAVNFYNSITKKVIDPAKDFKL